MPIIARKCETSLTDSLAKEYYKAHGLLWVLRNQGRFMRGKFAILGRLARRILLGLAALVCLLSPSTFAQVADAPPPVARPILFVHGWCGDAGAWGPMVGAIVNATSRSLYPFTAVYRLYFDRSSPLQVRLEITTVPCFPPQSSLRRQDGYS